MNSNNKSLLTELENAINSNPFCKGNLLLPNRVFCSERNGSPEILVSLNNRMERPHYWGHILKHGEKYVSLIVAIDYWVNPRSVDKLFSEFWYNLEEDGDWYPIGGDVFDIANNFEDAASNLGRMIANFDEDWTQDDIDFRVVQTYPFPNPFKKTA